MKLSVIIPVYNEAGNLTPLYQALVAAMDALEGDYEVIFVDDGSRDGSFQELTALVDAQLSRLSQVMEVDVVAFEALLRRLGVPAVAP